MKLYKGQRIAQMLEDIREMEERLKRLSDESSPFSQADYDELAQGYMYLAVSKAKLKALQGSSA